MKRAHRSTPESATEHHPQGTREHVRDVEPVSYFNDAVFAIDMTLLVVSIRVPSGTSARRSAARCAASVPHTRATESASS
jgi:hypothetical protein